MSLRAYSDDKRLDMAPMLLKHFIIYITQFSLVTAGFLNVALYKPAYLCSVYSSTAWTADCANDGFDDTHASSGHCALSATDNPGWWMVDLRGLYMVEQIILVNRGDNLQTSMRTRNFTFDLFLTDPRLSRDFPMEPGQVCFKRLEYLGQGETLTQNCTTPILGRFVRFIRIQVMASAATYMENNFLIKDNSFLQVPPYFVTYTPNPLTCTSLCVQRRDSETCTAVNWVRTTTECQLLKVNPLNVVPLSPSSNTVFCIEA